MRRMVFGTLGLLPLATFALLGVLATTPAWALGPAAPPQVGFTAVLISTVTTSNAPGPTSGVPQLLVQADSIVIPGGSVPANVQSVTVQIPGGQTFAITKGTNDLFSPETFYQVNLTQEGLPGFPSGDYLITVRDTANGQTQVTETFTAVTPLDAATNVNISGATQISPDLFRASFTSSSTPTITWTPAPGAVRQRVRMRPFAGPDLFSRAFNDGSINSTTLPGGVFYPGRIVQIIVEAQDSTSDLPTTNTRSRRFVTLIVDGPEIVLTRTGGTATGQTLTINATVFNTGGPVTIDVVVWIGLPSGQVITLLELAGVTIPSSTQSTPFFNGPIFTRLWDGSEGTGAFVVGIRFTEPPRDETLALSTLTFTR